MINRTTEEKLTEVTRQLDLPILHQEQITAQVNQARSAVTRLIVELLVENRAPQTEATAADIAEHVPERIEAVIGYRYYIGDQVEVLNPARGQETEGVVIGKTKDNLLRIQTVTEKVIRRLPKNVRLS